MKSHLTAFIDSKLHLIALSLVLLAGILASRTLLFQDGYFNMHDDLQMMRQLELEKCIWDGQIPCRWVPDMGYGFGFPLFNFYPPLPYIAGQLFRFMGLSFVVSAKYTFALALIASGLTMYYFAKEFFGKLGGFLAAIFYLWAPYHSVDIFVRGAMNEVWALVWFPLILLYSHNLIKYDREKKWIVGLTLSYAALLLTHNLMVLIFTPVLIGWILVHIFLNSDTSSFVKQAFSKAVPLVVSGLWAIGLAAFFTFPAILENKFTQLESQLEGYYNYTAHFISIRQLLFSRFWGYGPSVWLEEDGMSFQIGYIHWITSLFIGGVVAFILFRNFRSSDRIKRIKESSLAVITLYLLIVGWFAAFMTHPKSIFFWQTFSQIRVTQFPWRFLTLVIFGLSFAIGFIPKLMESKEKVLSFALAPIRLSVVFILSLGVVIYSWNYFLPEHGKMGPLTDDQKFSGAAWDLQQTAGIYDYLPATAEFAPREPMHQLVEVMNGEATITDETLGTNWATFNADIDSEDSELRLGIFQFPGWTTYVDELKIENYVPESEEWGRMYVNLPAGVHSVRVQFEDTPVRKVGNMISVVSWIAFCVYLIQFKNRYE